MATVTVFNKRSAEYRVFPVSGIMGGLTPQGMVSCDLFIERPEPPESIVLDIAADGTAKAVSQHPPNQAMIREAQCGVLFDPQVARAVGEWLVAQASAFEQRVLKGKETGGT